MLEQTQAERHLKDDLAVSHADQAHPDTALARELLFRGSYQGHLVNGLIDQDMDCCVETRWTSKRAVLIIEDCEPLLFFLNSALINLGYEDQHLAANLAEAEAVWAQHQNEISHIVLNYELPDGIGIAFAKRLLEDRPNVNIIVTTGYDISVIKETSELGSEIQLLQKPFRLAELQNAMNRCAVGI